MLHIITGIGGETLEYKMKQLTHETMPEFLRELQALVGKRLFTLRDIRDDTPWVAYAARSHDRDTAGRIAADQSEDGWTRPALHLLLPEPLKLAFINDFMVHTNKVSFAL